MSILVGDIDKEVVKVLDKKKLDEWWITPLPRFDGLMPFEVWEQLGPEVLLEYVKTYTKESFS